MSSMSNVFDFQRFTRVLANDLMSLQARRIGFQSLAIFGVILLTYMSNVGDAAPEAGEIAAVCFILVLLGGGQAFTGMIFSDMHHPLERYHYLMLPCSNLERFISRYLITAPFFVIYAIVFFKISEAMANAICALLWGNTIPPLELGSKELRLWILVYFASHVLVFTGAIWFRSYALIKTWATGALVWMVGALLAFVAVRLFYWDSFISLFEMNPEGPFPDINFEPGFDEDGIPRLWVKLLIAAFLLWMLFLAYLGLKEHEVQDGL